MSLIYTRGRQTKQEMDAKPSRERNAETSGRIHNRAKDGIIKVWRGRQTEPGEKHQSVQGRMPQQAGGIRNRAKDGFIKVWRGRQTKREMDATTSGRDTKPSKCLTNKVWRGHQTKQEMDTTQNGRGTPSQAGKDATTSRERNAETSGRIHNRAKDGFNKVWRGRQTKQEERRDKRERNETEQMFD